MLQVTPVRAFVSNYIWLIHAPRDANQVLAVDPGEAAPLEALLAARALRLAGLLITHHHGDHVGGVEELLRQHPVPVFGPAGESIPGRPRRLREADEVRLDELGLAFKVLDVPGHTAGHIAYVGHGALFCGDTLFSAGCGRLFEGTPAQMTTSLAKLAALPGDTLVYCAHEYTLSNLAFARAVEPGNTEIVRYLEECRRRQERGEPTLPAILRQERNVNPFLRCAQPSVKQAAELRAGHALHAPQEVFAVLRRWKDGFSG